MGNLLPLRFTASSVYLMLERSAMSIAINEWASVDFEVHALIQQLQPLCQASGCLGISSLLPIQNRAFIKQRLDACLLADGGEDSNWIRELIDVVFGYLDCGDVLIVFIKLDEADLLLIYSGACNNPVDIDNDNWIIVSLEPFLIMSMYGAVLGICEVPNGFDIVTIAEGDSGWGS